MNKKKNKDGKRKYAAACALLENIASVSNQYKLFT